MSLTFYQQTFSNPNPSTSSPSWVLLAGMGPVTPISIKIIGGDSASQIKNTGLSSVQPRTSKHKGSHLHQSQVAPLNSLFEGKKKRRKEHSCGRIEKCENDHLYNTAPGLNTEMPTMQMEIKTAQQTNSTEVSQEEHPGFRSQIHLKGSRAASILSFSFPKGLSCLSRASVSELGLQCPS